MQQSQKNDTALAMKENNDGYDYASLNTHSSSSSDRGSADDDQKFELKNFTPVTPLPFRVWLETRSRP